MLIKLCTTLVVSAQIIWPLNSSHSKFLMGEDYVINTRVAFIIIHLIETLFHSEYSMIQQIRRIYYEFHFLRLMLKPTLQFQIISSPPPSLLIFGFFVGPPFLFGSHLPSPPLINFPDFVLHIFQRLLKRTVLLAKL